METRLDNIELIISESTNDYVTKINLNTIPMYTKRFLAENNAADILSILESDYLKVKNS